jgi:hypothetical protein
MIAYELLTHRIQMVLLNNRLHQYHVPQEEVDQLIAEYARQREGQFVWKEFMDKFNRVGIIPVSLIYWEMTGDKSMLNSAIEGAK